MLTVNYESEIGTEESRAPAGGQMWFRTDVYRDGFRVASSGWCLEPETAELWLDSAYPELSSLGNQEETSENEALRAELEGGLRDEIRGNLRKFGVA